MKNLSLMKQCPDLTINLLKDINQEVKYQEDSFPLVKRLSRIWACLAQDLWVILWACSKILVWDMIQ